MTRTNAAATKRQQIRLISVDELRPHPMNARLHSEIQLEEIAASIMEFGFTNPVLVDDDRTILAGHGRCEAARLLRDRGETAWLAATGQALKPGFVPTIALVGLTEMQRRAYVLADNQTALNATWDIDLLEAELRELNDAGANMVSFGFSEADIARAIRGGGTADGDPDKVPGLPDDPVTKPGDVWVCGDHRIRCGDSTNADDVAALLDGAKPAIMVTDPPYGVRYDASWRNDATQAGRSAERWDGRGRAIGKVENDDRADWTEAWRLFPGDVGYVWHGALHAPVVAESLASTGFSIRSQIVWAKNHIAISRGHYHWQHEPCWYVVREGAAASWAGDRKQSTLWEIPKPQKSETGHSTQKPVECMRRPIANHGDASHAIYDPFLGSGTTVIAGEMERRAVFGMELNPAYVDVAVLRWMEFTERPAYREADGEPFPEAASG